MVRLTHTPTRWFEFDQINNFQFGIVEIVGFHLGHEPIDIRPPLKTWGH